MTFKIKHRGANGPTIATLPNKSKDSAIENPKDSKIIYSFNLDALSLRD